MAERLPLGWRWRKSMLGPMQTFVILLQMAAFGSRGYRNAMASLFEKVREDWGWDNIPSSAAFCKARRKHTALSLQELFADFSHICTHIGSHQQLEVSGFQRVLAIDGTSLTLNSKGSNKKEFGCPSGDHLAPQALLTVLWNVGGNAPVDWRVGRYDHSEVAHLQEMLTSVQAGDIVLADRLYAARSLMCQFIANKRHFVFRIKTKGRGCAKEFLSFVQGDQDEAIVKTQDPDTGEAFRVRLVRSHKEGAEHMVFATSVLNAETVSAEAIADLYHRRWQVETAYREGKDWLALAELPGRNKEQIQQEIAAVMLYWLMQAELEGQARSVYAEEIAKQKPVSLEHRPADGLKELPVRFNRSLAHTFICSVLRIGPTDPEEARVIWSQAITYLWRNRQRRKPGRRFRRTSQRPHDLKMRDHIARSQAKGGRDAKS